MAPVTNAARAVVHILFACRDCGQFDYLELRAVPGAGVETVDLRNGVTCTRCRDRAARAVASQLTLLETHRHDA